MSAEIRDLIRRMSLANPLWGAPQIHGELLKLGIEVSQATVGRFMPWRPKVPSPTWRSFLHNHLTDIAAIDMFVVATTTFQLLYVLIVLSHDRRKVIHVAVTSNPSQVWLAQQMTEAFPWDTAPRYLLRDRDSSYGSLFRDRIRVMGIKEVATAPRSPWQNAYVERLIGSIRRERLDHIIIFNEHHLRRVLSSYFLYHHQTRTHLSLGKDCPETRPIHPANHCQDHCLPGGWWSASSLRTSRRVSHFGNQKGGTFRRGGHSALQTYRSDAMSPGTHAGAHVAAATNILSNLSKLLSRDLIGEPIPRPDRFLSRDSWCSHCRRGRRRCVATAVVEVHYESLELWNAH